MLQPSSYGFRNMDHAPFMTLDSIGWTSVDSEEYVLSGRDRPDIGHVIFQYTLSGEGRLNIDGTLYHLHPQDAFLVKIPSNHKYYYDKSSNVPWEFIWFNVYGEDAVRLWERLILQEGTILKLDANSTTISLFWKLFQSISIDQLNDQFQLSVRVYELITSMLRPGQKTNSDSQIHPLIRRAKLFMQEQLAEPLTLDEIAANCGVSKHHLCRLFQKLENSTPFDYLRHRRIEAAVALLRNTELSISEISNKCGFESVSYFGKIFREYWGTSPRKYRQMKLEFPFEKVYLD
jgi:AraC-like DNA-binding protein